MSSSSGIHFGNNFNFTLKQFWQRRN